LVLSLKDYFFVSDHNGIFNVHGNSCFESEHLGKYVAFYTAIRLVQLPDKIMVCSAHTHLSLFVVPLIHLNADRL